MRKITEASVNAFKNARNFKTSNTEVYVWGENYTQFYLHGHQIAQIRGNVLLLDDCGRQTNTTKERLNWILREFGLGYIYQKNRTWYFVNANGEEEKREKRKTFDLN